MPGMSVHLPRNRCSASAGMSVHLAPESVFGFARNRRSKWSGIPSPVEFCKKEDLRPTSFQRWQERLGVGSAQAQFVPVTPEAPSMIGTPSWTLEITLSNGVQLRFQG